MEPQSAGQQEAVLQQARIDERLKCLEKAVSTIAWLLTQTPDSFGQQDARGIDRILRGEDENSQARADS